MATPSLFDLRAIRSRKNSRGGRASFVISLLGLAVFLLSIVFVLLTPVRGSSQEANFFVVLLGILSPVFGAMLSAVGLTFGFLALRKTPDRKLFSVPGVWLNGLLLIIFVVVSVLVVLDLFSRIPYA